MLSFFVFYNVIISLDTSFCPWIERFNPKSLVCKTQLATVGPKDLVHNPFKANTKTEAEIQVMIPGIHFFTVGYPEEAGESHLHLF